MYQFLILRMIDCVPIMVVCIPDILLSNRRFPQIIRTFSNDLRSWVVSGRGKSWERKQLSYKRKI
jgi:hypothetical protein